MQNTYSPTRPPKSTTGPSLWMGLRGAALALALAKHATRAAGPLLIVGNDVRQLELLLDELRFFSEPDLPILAFPDWEVLAYDGFSPHQGIVSTRLATLAKLEQLERGIILAQFSTSMLRLAPKEYVNSTSFHYAAGQILDLQKVRERLVASGYYSVSQVNDHGEFAIRGSLFDIFPAGSAQPVRIDLFDDEIESLRYFDPHTQLSGEHLSKLTVLPAHEYPLDEDGIKFFRGAFRRRFEGNPNDCVVYQHISEGIAAAGAEHYLPLFFESTNSLLEYLPEATTIVSLEPMADSLETVFEELENRHEQRAYDVSAPILTPHEIALKPGDWQQQAEQFAQIEVCAFNRQEDGEQVHRFDTGRLPDLAISAEAHRSGRLIEFIEGFEGRVLIVAESPGRRETVRELLADNKLRPQQLEGWDEFFSSGATLAVTVAPIQEGMLLPQSKVAVIAENQLFGHSQQRRKRVQKNKDPNAIIRNLNELTIGAPVVHETCGIGRYHGLNILEIDGEKSEFVTILYAGDDKLYVPVHALHLVSRYLGGDAEKAPLHRLGSDQWEKARKKAISRIRDVAADLLDLYARRAARVGQSFALNEAEYRAFAAGFPFELTVDQDNAIAAIIEDMTSLKPMDRLVCGDVGFGKTEVALRAAFICVNQSKQAAILVPTTLLAEQHGKNFEDRFADWPINVAVLSRFKSKKDADQIIDDLNAGKIDIVIGTHKLLQSDVKFPDLGLVVIDEEHRFGVRHKEQLKSLRAEVDVLTLTATPIPRTLNMAMGGIRELSLITTPPSERLSIKTFVTQWNDAQLREACLREIKRGGQIYFVHNAVKDIETIAAQLAKLVPEANIAIGHGQMKERELEQVMLDFYHRRFNLLVCTTIIESGIDVPTANTIIINKADRFGLAQLHQIRGRVGRSSHRAYAYLVTPPRKAMTADAVKRLEAIESLEDLGAGFTLATHDLEIRGAGELLGDDQSGQIHEVGFTLYMDLLERAVQSLKAGHEPDLGDLPARSSVVELHIPAILPEDYIPDVHTRLIQYKRVTSAENRAELRELKVEMIDRFGLLPEPANQLFEVAALRQRAQALGIAKIDCSDGGGRVVFEAHTNVDPSCLINLIQVNPQEFKLSSDNALRFNSELDTFAKRVAYLNRLMDRLSPKSGDGQAA